MIKNLNKNEILDLTQEVTYIDGQVVSKTLSQNKNVSMTLFAFPKGEGLTTHTSVGDAFVQVLDGNCLITIEDTNYELKAGDTIVMPANVPHSLEAITEFKMLLVVLFPEV